MLSELLYGDFEEGTEGFLVGMNQGYISKGDIEPSFDAILVEVKKLIDKIKESDIDNNDICTLLNFMMDFNSPDVWKYSANQYGDDTITRMQEKLCNIIDELEE